MNEASAITARSTQGVGATSAVQVKSSPTLETAIPPRGADSVQFSTTQSHSISSADMDRYVSMLQSMPSPRVEGATPEEAIVNGLINDL